MAHATTTGLLLGAALLAAGCATTAVPVPEAFAKTPGSTAEPGPGRGTPAVPASSTTAARRVTPVGTIEALQPQLRQALADLAAAPSAGAHTRVGQSYYGAGVLDKAMDHFDAALTLDRRSAAAYDGRARVWRQWGLLGPAVADANRAIYFAPGTAAVRNTMGTILLAMGDRVGAAVAYRCAAWLDPEARWARANLEALADGVAPSPGDCSRSRTPKRR